MPNQRTAMIESSTPGLCRTRNRKSRVRNEGQLWEGMESCGDGSRESEAESESVSMYQLRLRRTTS